MPVHSHRIFLNHFQSTTRKFSEVATSVSLTSPQTTNLQRNADAKTPQSTSKMGKEKPTPTLQSFKNQALSAGLCTSSLSYKINI